MASAHALGPASLRLRSRRVRSGRSNQLSARVVLAVIAVASGVGLVAVQGRTHPEPVVDAATIEQERFVSALRPIDAAIQHEVAEEGLLVADYEGGQIGRAELQRRLGDVLAGYRATANEIEALNTPPGLRDVLQADQAALRSLAQAGVALSQAYDDGDQTRVSAALASSLEATARLHALTDVLQPKK